MSPRYCGAGPGACVSGSKSRTHCAQYTNVSAISTTVAIAAGASRRRRAEMTAFSAAADVSALTNRAASRGRRLIHSSSPSIARVDQARWWAGLPKTNGLTASQAASKTAWLHRRVHAGTSVNGVLAQRVHALHGL